MSARVKWNEAGFLGSCILISKLIKMVYETVYEATLTCICMQVRLAHTWGASHERESSPQDNKCSLCVDAELMMIMTVICLLWLQPYKKETCIFKLE